MIRRAQRTLRSLETSPCYLVAMVQTQIRRCLQEDFDAILTIVNDGATAYKGHIPPDRWHEPYMSREELAGEISSGVEFWGMIEDAEFIAVIGMQQVEDVTLVRHAYVKSNRQHRGLGGEMLRHLKEIATSPILVGTWADATWAIRFYERHGFHVVGAGEKERLLRRYWRVPDRQIETSVVLADALWRSLGGHEQLGR